MANDLQQNDGEPQQQLTQVPPELPADGAKRRRLAKAGVGAAGVLWSLQSHSALASNKCATPSAFGSAGLNSSNHTEVACNPLPPSSWCSRSSWPCSRLKKFSEVFGCRDNLKDSYGRDTLLAVMRNAQYDDFRLGRHLAAAYLNVVSGRITTLDVPTLKRMWTEIMYGGGLFKVGPNKTWTAQEVRTYLVAIQGV
jgi:hypothetical protein